MTDTNKSKLPIWFWIVSSIALLWNLLGLLNFGNTMMMSPETLAQFSEAQQTLINNTPVWVNIAFGIAVIGGTLGCIGLLLRKAWAKPVFLFSLLGILVQMAYVFLLSDSFAVYGNVSMIMSLIVILIGCLLVWFADWSSKRNWLS